MLLSFDYWKLNFPLTSVARLLAWLFGWSGYKTANTNTAKLQESEHKTMKQQITKLQNRGKNKNTTKKFRELTSEDTFF